MHAQLDLSPDRKRLTEAELRKHIADDTFQFLSTRYLDPVITILFTKIEKLEKEGIRNWRLIVENAHFIKYRI